MKAPLAMLALTASLYSPSPSSAVTPEEAGRPIAEEDVVHWNKAIAQGSADGIAALFTEDAMLIQPNGKVVRDSSHIREFWKSLLESQPGKTQFALVKARRENDDTVVTRAVLSDSVTLGARENTMNYRYQGVVNNVLKRQANGAWKVQVQRWNDGSRLGEERSSVTP